LQVAIEQAVTILSWYENLPKEEIPPEYLWEDSEGLEMWWNSLDERREEKMGRYRQQGGDGGDEDAGMADNDMARFLKIDN
jgi:hypothetical protein